jgi:hypothetical protein
MVESPVMVRSQGLGEADGLAAGEDEGDAAAAGVGVTWEGAMGVLAAPFVPGRIRGWEMKAKR